MYFDRHFMFVISNAKNKINEEETWDRMADDHCKK